MSVHPTAFAPPNVTLACDLCGWSGAVALSALVFSKQATGTPDAHCLTVSCGNCGSVSTHPVSGGAMARAVQALFILKLMQAQSLTFVQAMALVKAAAENMDGVGRFQWGQAQQANDLATL